MLLDLSQKKRSKMYPLRKSWAISESTPAAVFVSSHLDRNATSVPIPGPPSRRILLQAADIQRFLHHLRISSPVSSCALRKSLRQASAQHLRTIHRTCINMYMSDFRMFQKESRNVPPRTLLPRKRADEHGVETGRR